MFHGSQPALQSDPGFAESESTRDHSRFNHEKIAMSFPRHQFSLTMHDPGAHDYVQKIVLRDTPTLQTQYKHIPVCDAVMQYDTMKDDDVKEKAY